MEGQGGRLNVVKVLHERDAEPVLELGGRVVETRIIRGSRGERDKYIHLIEMSHRSRMRFDLEMKVGGQHWIHVESTGPPHDPASDAASKRTDAVECVTDSVPAVSVAKSGCSAAKRARSATDVAAAAAITPCAESEWQPATVKWNGKPAKALVMRVPGSTPAMYQVRWKQGRHGFCEGSEAVGEADVVF